MLVTLKTTADLELNLSTGKPYILKGWGIINDIQDSVWDALYKENVNVLKDMLDNGFIVTSKTQDAKIKNAKDDVLQEALDIQEKAIKNNEKTKGVKLRKD